MFVIKFYFGNDIRRIALSEQVPFSTLTGLVKDLFSSNLPEKFVFKYVDNENDVITVTSDEELQEAFQVSQKQVPSLLKFEVVPISKSSKSTPLFGFQPTNSNSNSNSTPQFNGCGMFANGFPHPASCDSCGNRIFGLRLKCLNCPDYDLCFQCSTIDGVHDKEHVFMKVHPSTYFAEQNASFSPAWSGCCNQQEDFMEEEPTVPKPNSSSEPRGMEGKSEEAPKQTANANGNSAPSKELNPFQLKLKQLEEMGFVDRERNISVLLKNDGNVVQTVKDLLGA